MKRLTFILLIFIPLLSTAQVTKERRVYYLDCTYTMKKPNKIWDDVRDNLKKAINNVNDETTELVVIPFWDRNEQLTSYTQLATEQGKKQLCKVIDGLDCPTSSYTLLSIPLNDFYNNRVSTNSDCITYMFFMTDGENEDQEEKMKFGKVRFYDSLSKWGQRYGDKQVYGFYVMLCDAAKIKKVEDIVNNQPHLWKVETADVNINIIRLDTKAIFNVRDDKYVDIPIFSGKLGGVNFEVQLDDETYYHVTKTEVVGDKLRVYISPSEGQTTGTLPEEVKGNLKIKVSDEYAFPVPDNVVLTCYNKKQYTLKVSVRP